MKNILFNSDIKKYLLAVFIIALILRLVMIMIADRMPVREPGDQNVYRELAHNLAEGRGYYSEIENKLAYRPPFYPMTISAVYFLGGGDTAVRVFQALLGSLSCILIYFLGIYYFSSGTARIGALLAALYPELIYFTAQYLSETVFIFLLLLLLIILGIWEKRGGPAFTFAAGIINGIGILCRPSLILFTPVYAVWILIRRRTYAKKIITGLLLLFISTALTMLPWIMRNYKVLGKFVPVCTMGGLVLWMGSADTATGMYYLPDDWRDSFPPGLSEAELDKAAQKEGLQNLLKNPGRSFILGLKKIWLTLDALGHPLMQVSWFALLLLSVIGLIRAVILKNSPGTLNLFVLYALGIQTLFIGQPRYHLPLVPILILYTAFLFSFLLKEDVSHGAHEGHKVDS